LTGWSPVKPAEGELEEAPALDLSPEAFEARFREGFTRSDIPSVGLEEELVLVDCESFEPVEAVDWALDLMEEKCFVPELRAAQIEVALPPAVTVGGLVAGLERSRTHLVERLNGRVRVLAAGGHPTLSRPICVTDRPRYVGIGRDHAWAMRRGLPCGLHVHVAVGDAETALAVYNAARAYLPELAAIAANSPFFEGTDSGLASSRLKITEDLPRSGVPPAFGSWRELAEFVSWGSVGGLFHDLTYLWWDLRLRPEYGTLEFRIADAQASPEVSGAVAAVCQSLVSALVESVTSGEVPVHPTHVLSENRWRAVRDGLEAVLVDPVSGLPEPARHRVARLLLELEPHAEKLGCASELAHAWPLLSCNGAESQRAVAADRGMSGLLEWLVERTEAPAGSLPPATELLPSP
jgi:carboxylate-amine ligase